MEIFLLRNIFSLFSFALEDKHIERTTRTTTTRIRLWRRVKQSIGAQERKVKWKAKCEKKEKRNKKKMKNTHKVVEHKNCSSYRIVCFLSCKSIFHFISITLCVRIMLGGHTNTIIPGMKWKKIKRKYREEKNQKIQKKKEGKMEKNNKIFVSCAHLHLVLYRKERKKKSFILLHFAQFTSCLLFIKCCILKYLCVRKKQRNFSVSHRFVSVSFLIFHSKKANKTSRQ